MALKALVKVGNITNLSDARYCAGMGVELLGFVVIDDRENFINAKTYQEIRGWLSGVSVVAEAYGLTSSLSAAILENYVPDFIELSATDLAHLPGENETPLIVSVNNQDDVVRTALWKNKIAYLLLDPSLVTKDFIATLAGEYAVLVKGDTSKTLELLDQLPIKGITLLGSDEIKPGLKDYDHLSAVLEQLEEAD